MLTIKKARNAFTVEFPYDPDTVKKIKAVPGAEWDKERRVWRVPQDPYVAIALLSTFGEESVHLDVGVGAAIREMADRFEALEALRAASDCGGLKYELADKLYPYQRVAVKFLSEAGGGLLGDKMGLGKTVEAVATIREIELLEQRDTQSITLIVCPNSMRHTWADEVRRWYPEEVPVYVIGERGCPKLSDREPGFYIVNWEKLFRRPELLTTEWDFAIGDEAHRMKGRDTKSSKAMRKVKARHRLLLTGTPIRNEVTDLFPLLAWLEPDRWTSYWKFYDRYVEFKQGFFGREVVGIKNTDELTKRLSSVMIARTLDDVDLQLPPVIGPRTISVELGSLQRKAYDEMREEFVTWVKGADDAIIAANWMTQVLRLKQIAGSLGIFSKDFADSAKLDALMELIEDMDGDDKMVVMSQFRSMVDQTTERFRKAGICYCELTGGSALAWHPSTGEHHAKTRQELIDWFQSSDKPRVFIATTQTGGEGITLTAARYFTFLDLLWTPGENEQAWKRIHRVGQTKTCFVYRILAQDTVDFSAILPKLRSKQSLIDAVMRPNSDVDDDAA